MAKTTTYSIKAKVASRGYHVYKNTKWVNAKEGDEVQAEIETNEDSVKVNPYTYAIRVKGNYFDVTKTVGHIPREICRHVYFFIKVAATDMRYFARSKFFRSLVHKKNFILT